MITEYILNIYDTICRFLGFYDTHGVKHSSKHLDSIREEFSFYDIKKQAKYVDSKTFNEYELSPKFRQFTYAQIISAHYDIINKQFDFEFFNTTYYGNIAYIHLHTNSVQIKNMSYAILQAYAVYTMQKINKRITS